jgi:hypothetical protein
MYAALFLLNNRSGFSQPNASLFHERGVNAQWRQLKHVKAFILRQWLARFQLAALDLPMNKNLDSLKLTPLRERIRFIFSLHLIFPLLKSNAS